MIRQLLSAILLGLFLIGSALALTSGQQAILFGGCPLGSKVYADFSKSKYCGGVLNSLFSITRASSGVAFTKAGLLITFGNNQFRITDQGLLIEEARTDDALWVRDLTNAAWTKVGATAALNAIGIDGTANSATTLTATGSAGVCTASCTALQTITLGSSADTYSVYLKRVTGSGAVNITINNLVGSQACTLITTAFTRCTVTATLANPVFGIQMTTVGDVIIADWNQLEPGGFPTSPIAPAATTVTVTRAADNIQATGALLVTLKSTVLTQLTKTFGVSGNSGSARLGVSFNGAATPTFINNGALTQVGIYNGAVVTSATLGSSANLSSSIKTVASFDASGDSIVSNGGSEVTSANIFPAVTSAWFGNDSGIGSYTNGYFVNVVWWISRLPSATRIQLSQP